jgi:hypothetical protein
MVDRTNILAQFSRLGERSVAANWRSQQFGWKYMTGMLWRLDAVITPSNLYRSAKN